MARLIYALCLTLATPLIWLRLLWRGRQLAGYRQHIGERWGYYSGPASCQPTLWVHAVSVGETRAAAPLVDALQSRYPGHRIVLTCMTPTGREAGAVVYGERVIQAYLPYDTVGSMRRFLDHFRPEFGVLMETEIWPNLLHVCVQRKLPVFLANARLSARSARGYQRFSALTGNAFRTLRGVAAQTREDAERLQALGAQPVRICGNLKFDVAIPPSAPALAADWRRIIGERPVWLAASTREGEEAEILAAWRPYAARALLVIVPRHPQRFAEVETMIAAQGLRQTRRSVCPAGSEVEVWLGDSMGEMPAYYALADLAFVGGSLQPLGGQNFIEAAALGCPVLIGPHTFNFAEASTQALAAGAAVRVGSGEQLVSEVLRLLDDAAARAQMKTAGLAFAEAHRGATARTVEFIAQQLSQAGY